MTARFLFETNMAGNRFTLAQSEGFVQVRYFWQARGILVPDLITEIGGTDCEWGKLETSLPAPSKLR